MCMLQSPHNLTSCSDRLHEHFLLLRAACCTNLSLQSPPVPLSYCHACAEISLAVCIMYTTYLSDTVCVCRVLFCTSLRVFYVLRSESHTVWIHLGNTPKRISDKYNCIFICWEEKKPPKFLNHSHISDSTALTASADITVENVLQYVLFITNNKNMKPAV